MEFQVGDLGDWDPELPQEHVGRSYSAHLRPVTMSTWITAIALSSIVVTAWLFVKWGAYTKARVNPFHPTLSPSSTVSVSVEGDRQQDADCGATALRDQSYVPARPRDGVVGGTSVLPPSQLLPCRQREEEERRRESGPQCGVHPGHVIEPGRMIKAALEIVSASSAELIRRATDGFGVAAGRLRLGDTEDDPPTVAGIPPVAILAGALTKFALASFDPELQVQGTTAVAVGPAATAVGPTASRAPTTSLILVDAERSAQRGRGTETFRRNGWSLWPEDWTAARLSDALF
jgi:hypothetical protein